MGGHPKLVFVVEFILFCEDNVCVYSTAVSLYHVCSSSYLNISPSFLICITPSLPIAFFMERVKLFLW